MKIIFAVYNASAKGSVVATTRRQAEFLADGGHEVILLGNENPGWRDVRFVPLPAPKRSQRLKQYIADGIGRRLPSAMSRFDLRQYVEQVHFSEGVVRAIADSPALRDSDGCICCQHFAAFGLSEVKHTLGIPYLLVAHGDIFTHPNSAFPIALRRFYKRAAKLGYRDADFLVAVSTSIARRASAFRRDDKRVAIIANGIEVDDLGAPPRPQPKSDVTRVLFVGRLSPEKNVSSIIGALETLTDIPIAATIVGDGPERQRLESEVQSAKLMNVKFAGFVERRRLADYYANSDIVVLPSLTEAQPLVTLEAGIASKPIIATDVGGVSDVVEHERTGILYRSNSTSELSEAIRRLAADPALRQEMGRRANRVVARFRWGTVLTRFAETVNTAFPNKEMTC